MSSLVSKAGPESEWGSDSRIAAVRRWHEKSVASRHDQSVLLLDGADLRPGLRVLDLACGAGTPALAEARRVGPRGNVVGTDTSEAMLSLAREYAQEEGLADAGCERWREPWNEVSWSWPGPRGEMCEVFYGGAPPFRGILDRLDADSRRQAMAEATEMLRKFYSEGRVRVPEIVILVTGVRPSNPPQRKSTRSAK